MGVFKECAQKYLGIAPTLENLKALTDAQAGKIYKAALLGQGVRRRHRAARGHRATNGSVPLDCVWPTLCIATTRRQVRVAARCWHSTVHCVRSNVRVLPHRAERGAARCRCRSATRC